MKFVIIMIISMENSNYNTLLSGNVNKNRTRLANTCANSLYDG